MIYCKNKVRRTRLRFGLGTLLLLVTLICIVAGLIHILVSAHIAEFEHEQESIDYVKNVHLASVVLEPRGPRWLVLYCQLTGRGYASYRVVEVELELPCYADAQPDREKERVKQEMSELFMHLEWLKVSTSFEDKDAGTHRFETESIPIGDHPLH